MAAEDPQTGERRRDFQPDLPPDPPVREVRRLQKGRAIVMAILLFAFVILVYAITIAKMGLYSS